MIDHKVVTTRLLKYTLVIALLWTLFIIGLFWRDFIEIHHFILENSKIEARTIFQKDIIFRKWAASHGGVYVPATEETPPNPYLDHIPDRDITLPYGKILTLMNPAYMTRQLNERYASEYEPFVHITSLKLLNPNNEPDEFELKALKTFESGNTEEVISADSIIDGTPYLRLIRPIFIEEACLKCHAHQGYKVGDVRGGISVSLPMEKYLVHEAEERFNHSLLYLVIWIVGLSGIGISSRMLNDQFQKKGRIENRLRKYQDDLENIISERTIELRQEIEERKQAEETIKEREEKYHALMEQMTLGIASHQIGRAHV